MLYVRDDILAKFLSHYFPSAESFFIEINLYKKKWLVNCSYNPTRVTLENIFTSSVDHWTHFLTNMGILYVLVILIHVLMICNLQILFFA